MTGQETDRGGWSRLRMAGHKGLGGTSSALGRVLKHPIRAVLAVLFLVIAVLWTHEWLYRKLEAVDTVWLSSDRTGLILIDMPQLYTRERLVNHRFREAAWLKQRLDDTDDLLNQQRFGQADLFLTAIRDLKLHASKVEAANEYDPSSPAPIPATPSQDLQPSPQDEFDDVLRYREAIRESLMAAQLDDRHDIAGNTIYRLNFRATILPEPGTKKLAAIVVNLKENINDQQKNGDGSLYFDLLYDWRDELQRQIIDLVDDKTNTILKGSALISREQRDLVDYLDQNMRTHQISDFRNEVYRRVFKNRKESFDNAILDSLGMIKSVIKSDEERDNILNRYRNVCSQKLRQSGGPEPVLLEPGDITHITGRTINPSPDSVRCEIFGLNELLLKMDSLYILDFLIGDNQIERGTIDSCSTAEALIYVLSGSPEPKCKGAVDAILPRWEHVDERMRWQGILSNFVANFLKKKEAGMRIAKFDKQLVLGDFFDFYTEDCWDYCYPIVTFRGDRDGNWDGGQNGGLDSQCFSDEDLERVKNEPSLIPVKLADCLEQALSPAGVATYAVMPEKAVQRLQLLEREALAMDAAEGGVLSFGGREVAETAALEREAIAFGIGDWGSKSLSDESDTKFAWVIMPRHRPWRGGRSEQAADHVSVSAVVSAPSWWKSVVLTVDTCWLDSINLPENFDPDKLCESPDFEYEFEVALPGNAAEIMTKLRFEVLTFPYLFGGQLQYQNVLEVGRKGSLIILGGRLWRSPRVIMGNQIADRIEVLPDMDGIVAHFNCVQPYPGTPGAPGKADTSQTRLPPQSAPLRAVVWTSEGRTGYLEVELRPYRRRAGEQTEDPCWLHEGENNR